MHQGQVCSSVTSERLTGCLSAQRTGMIGSWPAEDGPATFTYIHTYIYHSNCHVACVCVCVQVCK